MARFDDPDVRLLRALRAAAPGERVVVPGEWESCLERLHAAGYEIEGERGVGWRLVSAPATLIADDVLATLPVGLTPSIGREIVVFEETGSTNDVAARAGDDGQAEGLVIFAEKQRAGRGRLGRVWESPPRQGLWFSVLLRPSVPVERWTELTFCAALAVAETAELHTGRPARIKWPNDVLMNGRKIAGILLESHQRQNPGFVVVGIGVNVLQAEEDFDPELRQRAGSLVMIADQPSHIERRTAAASLLRNLEEHYNGWPAGFSSIREACEQRGCFPPGAG